MTIGKKVEDRGHIVGFKEEISKVALSSDDEFFSFGYQRVPLIKMLLLSEEVGILSFI